LLAIAALGLVIARTGLLPAKITALGIEFSQVQQQAMLTMVAAFLANFAVTFAVHAVADYFAWRKKQEISALASVGKRHGMQFDRLVKESESGNLSALIAKLDPIDREREQERVRQRADEIIKARKGRLKKAYGISIWARATFDLSIPLLLAGAAMFALLTASPPDRDR
jgi:hypothetical protein